LLNPRVCNANVEGIVLKLQWKGFHDKKPSSIVKIFWNLVLKMYCDLDLEKLCYGVCKASRGF